MVRRSDPASAGPVGNGPPGVGLDSSLELLRKVKGGEPGALDRLCGLYLPALRRWAQGRLPRWARTALDTEDLVQETLLATLRNVGDFEPRHEGAFRAYLRQALQNRIQEELRKAHRRPATTGLDQRAADGGPSPLEEAIGHEDLARYEAGLAKLRPEDREAVVLRVEMGASYAEMAEALGKPSANAARMAVCRALLRLGEAIAHER